MQCDARTVPLQAGSKPTQAYKQTPARGHQQDDTVAAHLRTCLMRFMVILTFEGAWAWHQTLRLYKGLQIAHGVAATRDECGRC